MKIYYLVPDSQRPGWGLGLIYHHVQILNDNGFGAYIVKEGKPAAPAWLDIKVPILGYATFRSNISENDILVVPEVMMDVIGLKKIKCRKVLFVQASAYLFESLPEGEDHISLGFRHAFIIMPHLVSIVERHIKLPYTIIPPFIANYFFTGDLSLNRKRRILIYPKFHQMDYSIVKYVLGRHINEINKSRIKNILKEQNWRVKELKDMNHKGVAKEMKRSMFFISLNTFEALNTSVVEAMAAGCIVFCYEGIGPKDYLKSGINSFVFNNNEAYRLAEEVCRVVDGLDAEARRLKSIQREACSSAQNYAMKHCKMALLNYFGEIWR